MSKDLYSGAHKSEWKEQLDLHGKWIIMAVDNGWKSKIVCSNCGNTCRRKLTEYCSSCGSKNGLQVIEEWRLH